MQDSKRVLIVEDDFLVGEKLRGMLEEAGHTVVGVIASGKQAVEMTADLQPDVITMDFKLLDLDGITAARQITDHCPTPIILLTAYETLDLVAEASAAGVSYYLVKPVSRGDLLRALNIASARFADLQELRRLNTALQAEIAERQRAEEALRIRDNALATSINAIAMADLEGNLTYVNAAFLDLWGYDTEQEVLGRPAVAFWQYPEQATNVIKALQTSGGWVGELVATKKDGSLAHVQLSASMAKDKAGTPLCIMASFVDITERKHAEHVLAEKTQALQRSEERYRFLVDNTSDYISSFDRNGVALFVTGASRRFHGYEPDELVNTSGFERVHPDDQHLVQNALKDVITTGADQRVEYRVKHKNGTYMWIEAIGRRVYNNSGEPEVIVTVRDIAERKRAEQDIARYMAQLERSNEELQQFAYVISHDLREPLRMVQSFLNLLHKHYQDQLDDRANDFIHFAVDGAERMKGLINALLDYARVDSQGQDLVRTDANTVLNAALHTLQFKIEESGGTVTYDPLPTVLADPTQLGQLFQNLISNALKFQSSNVLPHIHITAEREKRADNPMWVFSVCDNGIGIPQNQQARIFGIFQRLHTREAYEGTGIGLAICKRIVERHGGRIWVESDVGEGSTFYFTLPNDGTVTEIHFSKQA